MFALSIYSPFLPNENEFLGNLGDDWGFGEEFLASLHSTDTLLIIAFIIPSIIACISYYLWYNNIVKPWGYHYRKRHWFMWLFIAVILSLGFTYLVEKAKLVNVDLIGAAKFRYMIYVANAIYSIVVYFICSVIWCNWLPTNAYRWFNWFNRK